MGTGDPAFYLTPSCPFYDYPLGESSPYGQQSLQYLGVLSRVVGAGSAWPAAMGLTLERSYFSFYNAGNGTCHTGKGTCYLDGSTKGFLQNVGAGKNFPSCEADDDQAAQHPTVAWHSNAVPNRSCWLIACRRL